MRGIKINFSDLAGNFFLLNKILKEFLLYTQ